MDFVNWLSWVAVIILPLGYWKQIWHIHKHREVRDLNLTSYIFFAIAYLFLGAEAYLIDSKLFLIKNILVIVPTLILISQIIRHKGDKWVEECEYEKMSERARCPRYSQMNKRINTKKAL